MGRVRRLLTPKGATSLGRALLAISERVSRERVETQRERFEDGFVMWYTPVAHENLGPGWYTQAPNGGTLGTAPTHEDALQDLAEMGRQVEAQKGGTDK